MFLEKCWPITTFLILITCITLVSSADDILDRTKRQSVSFPSPQKFDVPAPVTFDFGNLQSGFFGGSQQGNSRPGNQPGFVIGNQQGNNPGNQAGFFPGNQQGINRPTGFVIGHQHGNNAGNQPGFFPGNQQGNPSNSNIPRHCRGNRIRTPACREYLQQQTGGGSSNSNDCRGNRRNRPECQNQGGGRPNCKGNRRNRPECQNQGGGRPNCKGNRRNRPECQNQGGGGGRPNKPNCKGNRRNRPECQGSGGGGRPNCEERRKNRPECKNQDLKNDQAVKDAFKKVPWLKRLTTDNVSLSLPGLPETPTRLGQTRFYQINLGADDVPFQQCVTPSFEPGHCRFLQHCILDEFIFSFNVFLRYVCFIEGRYVGSCCPDSRYPDQTTPTQRPTTIPTTTKRPPTPTNSRGCGINSLQQTKIVGGHDAQLNKFPWAAALLRDGATQYCGGALITTQHVLTAAHCVDGFDASTITLRLGEYSFNQQDETPHKDFRVAQIKMHEEYDTSTYVNDIAILKMDRDTGFSDSIWPICLPAKHILFTRGEIATVIGWGTIYFGGPVSPVLQEVSIPVWRNEDCDAAYKDNKVFAKNICAGDQQGGKDSCQGDSGGPLMLQSGGERRWTIIGVVSWGIRCADPGNPGVYARVSEFIDWIHENAQ